MNTSISYSIDSIIVGTDGKLKKLIINGTDVIEEIKKDVIASLPKTTSKTTAKNTSKLTK